MQDPQKKLKNRFSNYKKEYETIKSLSKPNYIKTSGRVQTVINTENYWKWYQSDLQRNFYEMFLLTPRPSFVFEMSFHANFQREIYNAVGRKQTFLKNDVLSNLLSH